MSPIRGGVIVTVESAAPLISPAYAEGAIEDDLRVSGLQHYGGELLRSEGAAVSEAKETIVSNSGS